MLPTKELMQEILAPYHAMILDAVEAAWDEWKKKHAPFFPWPRRTLTVCMHEAIERELRTRLGSQAGVVLADPENDRFFLHLTGPDVLLFVKKFDDRFHIRNYPTETATRFNGQADLPNVPDAPRITIGYRVTTTRTELVGVFVALLKGDDLQWSYELVRSPDGGASIVPDYPSLPLDTPALKLKPGRQAKAGE